MMVGFRCVLAVRKVIEGFRLDSRLRGNDKSGGNSLHLQGDLRVGSIEKGASILVIPAEAGIQLKLLAVHFIDVGEGCLEKFYPFSI